MDIIVGCEESGEIRRAFRERGHNAYSCDLQEASDGETQYHIQDDILNVINQREWDMGIFHPPCTYLANSGVWLLYRQDDRWEKMEQAAEFFWKLLNCGIPRIVVENPVIHKYALDIIGEKYSQTIQPWQFGEDASKRTCLWLKGVPPLIPTKIFVCFKTSFSRYWPTLTGDLKVR